MASNRATVPLLAALLAACSGPQSALSPAADESGRLAGLFWGMLAGSVVILLVVTALTLHATYSDQARDSKRLADLLIIGGGAVFPTVVLTGLLSYGLWLIPRFLAPAPANALRVDVIGEQWWWRVRYHLEDGSKVELANEIRLPSNRPVEFMLSSPDVIHSFWIPSLGGKMDMIPGRDTRLTLHPTRPGTYRGVCAEYCGTSHALMAFPVVVHEARQFEGWLEGQRQPAPPARGDTAVRGQELFLSNGCGACHTVRGTSAHGVVGPDLTHVGSRSTLGAGTLGTGVEALQRWIARTDHIKPEVKMPSFGMLADADVRAIATYLEGLK